MLRLAAPGGTYPIMIGPPSPFSVAACICAGNCCLLVYWLVLGSSVTSECCQAGGRCHICPDVVHISVAAAESGTTIGNVLVTCTEHVCLWEPVCSQGWSRGMLQLPADEGAWAMDAWWWRWCCTFSGSLSPASVIAIPDAADSVLTCAGCADTFQLTAVVIG
jgi:hypothetical protein